MAQFAAIPAKQWGIPVSQLLSLIQLAVLEPDTLGVNWPSGMWSFGDVLGYVNNRQRQFLAESGITRAIGFIPGAPTQSSYALPPTTIDVARAAWGGGPAPTGHADLAREDSWELDEGTDGWPQSAAREPSAYRVNLLGVQQIQLTPIPQDVGEMELTTTDTGTTVVAIGTPLSIPDDWAPYLAWGVLADMLSKPGEGNDPDRAAYCLSRFFEGIALARLMIEGTTA